MIKCKKCGQFINTGPGEKCPNCGATVRLISEKVSETIGMIDSVAKILERINFKILLLNIVLMFLASALGFFFAGIQGIVIGFFVGIIILIVIPHFREKTID